MVALESCLFMRDQLLADIDWASMAHSLEVRVPLVDPFLLRKIAPVLMNARGDRKLLLARSPRRPLPPEVFERRKRGFTVPVREWLGEREPAATRRAYGMRLWAKRISEWTMER
ncbi:MAG TPA: asparagine synthase-related protein, partial [Rhodothermia bacterium]|nr:asparagine synthase-related protein [Rhodothermia bacterium]